MAKTNKILIFWTFISLLLLSCDPDEGIEKVIPNDNILKDCKDNKPTLTLQTKGKPKVNYSDDPLYKQQWYLHNTTIKGLDINIVPAWNKGYGSESIAVGILDNAIEPSHPDLDNIEIVNDSNNYDATIKHGTAVTGLIAARDNNIGIIGVVPNATVYSYGILGSNVDAYQRLISALQHKSNEIAVYNFSFGYNHDLYYLPLDSNVKTTMDRISTQGYGNKGANLVFAAGNSKNIARNDGYSQHHAVIAVNAIKQDGQVPKPDFGSSGNTEGVNLWLIAPTGNVTTAGGDYINDFARTSSAAPLVTGAIALLRSEFPTLTWRDIKLILAESASKYDNASEAQYRKSGCFYSNSAVEQQYSHTMGFGLLDVSQALALAQNWRPLPRMKAQTYSSTTVAQEDSEEYSHHFTVNSNITFIESLVLDIEHKGPDDRPMGPKITISNPKGIKAEIQLYFIAENISLSFNTFLGSSAAGIWKVTINRPRTKASKVSLTFRGH